MKKLWILTACIAVAGIAVGALIIRSQVPQTKIQEAPGTTPIPPPDELVRWKDDAGFSFSYPEDISVDKNEEDPDNYAHVELTHPDHPGNIIVWVSDVPTAWPPKGVSVIDTTLGGSPAKKFMTPTPYRMVTVGTISDNLLFKIEGTLTDSEYWQGVHDAVTASFAFTDWGGEPAQTVPVDEEEVLD